MRAPRRRMRRSASRSGTASDVSPSSSIRPAHPHRPAMPWPCHRSSVHSRRMWTTALVTFFAIEALLRLALGLRVIGRRLTAGQTMGWLLVLIFVPVLSVVAYLLIGEYRLGSRRARRYVEVTKEIRQRINA